MRIRAMKTMAGPWGLIMCGDTGIVPDDVGNRLIEAGYAKSVSDEKQEEPEEPEEPDEPEKEDVRPPVETATIETTERAMFEPPPRRRRKV